MEVLFEKQKDKLIIYPVGRIDSISCISFEKKVNKEIHEDSNIIFDFRDLEYITSAGMRNILTFKKRTSKGSLKIINASKEVYDVFNTTGFNTIIDISKMETEIFTYYAWSFKKFLEKKVEVNPNLVIIMDDNNSYTYLDIEKCSQIIASDLYEKGVRKGSHVGIYGGNSVNWVLTFFAVQKIGAIACLLNSACNVSELKNISKVGDIDFLCYGNKTKINDENIIVEEVINSNESFFKGGYSFNNSINFKLREEEYPKIQPLFQNYVEGDDVCVMLYTSGSTGTPKGVLLSAFNILNSSLSEYIGIDINSTDKICLILPLFHIFGLTAGLFCNLIANAPMYIIDDIKTINILNVIYKEKCTVMHSVPTMMLALMNNQDFTKEKVSSLRCCILAGAATLKAQLLKMQENFVNTKFFISYGLSELAPISITKPGDTIEHLTETVGVPVTYINIKIQDMQNLKFLNQGEVGEILAGGYSCFVGYYKKEIDKQALDEGFIHTGDLGFLDENNYLHLTGRAKELIIRGGENIMPNEIVSEISKYNKVSDVKVIGAPDDFYGEIVVACILPKDKEKISEEEIKNFLEDKLAKYKMPAHYIFYDKFPMLASGKVDMVNLKIDAINKLKK